MKKTTELTTKLEFLITLDNNIVCQRFFNVKGYNPEVRRSLDLYYTVREIAEDIQRDLKMKSIEFLYESEKFLANVTDQNSGSIIESFIIQIKLGEDIIIARQFPANIYPPKVRYTVDVRPQIKSMLSRIADTLSLEEYEQEYLDFVL